MNDQRQIDIVLKAVDEASAVLKNIGKETENLGSTAKSSLIGGLQVAAIAGGAAITALGVAAYDSVKAFQESESVSAQLGAVLKSTAGAAGITKDAAIGLSQAIEKNTSLSDEAVLGGENMLLTFTNIGKDVFPQTTQAVVDMAQAMNGGATPSMQQVQQEAILVGKALQDPDKGLGALHRVGVNVDELKKKFTANMSIMEKQKLIVQELGTEFGGSAAAHAQTFQGKMEHLGQVVDDLKERFGGFIVTIITPMLDWLSQLSTHTETLADFWGALTGRIQTSSPVIQAIQSAVGIWAVQIRDIWQAIQQDLMPSLQAWWKIMEPILLPVLKAIAVVIGGTLFVAITALLAVVKGVVEIFKIFFDISTAIESKFISLYGWIGKVTHGFGGLKDALKSINIGNLAGGLSSILSGVRAEGGSVNSGGAYLVGEHEPELFVPNTSGRIYNQQQMNHSTVVNVNVGSVDSSERAQQVGYEITAALGRMGVRALNGGY